MSSQLFLCTVLQRGILSWALFDQCRCNWLVVPLTGEQLFFFCVSESLFIMAATNECDMWKTLLSCGAGNRFFYIRRKLPFLPHPPFLWLVCSMAGHREGTNWLCANKIIINCALQLKELPRQRRSPRRVSTPCTGRARLWVAVRDQPTVQSQHWMVVTQPQRRRSCGLLTRRSRCRKVH